MSATNTQPVTAPAVASGDLLAAAYGKAGDLRYAFHTAEWSNGLSLRDHRRIAELCAKAQNLENLIYRALHANTKLSGGGD